MELYKHKDLFVLLTMVGWLSFIYSAFKGFHFWYLGFVFFLWLCLGILNYRQESSLWLMKNRLSRFIKFYLFLAGIGFLGDYIVGQKLISLWNYPPYSSINDWLRLYLLLYPIGGLSLVELIYFMAGIFKERVVLIHQDVRNLIITKLEILTDILLISIIFLGSVSAILMNFYYTQTIIVALLAIWAVLTTFKLKYHLKHWTHWIAILATTVILAIFLHEFPNTAVYEWKYSALHLFPNYSVFNIPLWAFLAWYVMVLVILKFWIQIVLLNHRK